MPEKELLNDRYRIEEQLGKGGMAVVYRARDLMLERDVSIKILREDYSSDPAFRERFRQEAKAAANLSHSNIVTIHDFGLDENRLFIVMEYVPGKDLNTIIKERSRFKIEEGISLAVQACAGIGYAHRAGLVHCDVKPHNFLITPDNRLKVTDFGIARALASINPDEEADIVWGSPQYFSPEQAAGSAPSPSSDVYSLGIVMYQMFTGQLPFFAKTTKEFSRQHRSAKPIPPRELNPFISQELEEIILKVLSKEPSARYRTADQLGRVLMTFSIQSDDILAETPSGSEAETPSKPIRSTRRSQVTATGELSPTQDTLEPNERSNIDWLAVGLAIIAMITSGGLIPYWIWVYFSTNQPIR
ncbi:MAG: serine/threonine protein kinase [Chloroflexi bacterium]|nr:serine/threonine protein kinase [Chloroflexota bacterium]